jgi:hypothetical protein
LAPKEVTIGQAYMEEQEGGQDPVMVDRARPARSSEREEAVAALSGGVWLGLTLTAPTIPAPFIPPTP